MSWENDVFGGDDQIFEDDFSLYKQHKAREQARWGGGSSGGSDDTEGCEWPIVPSFGGRSARFTSGEGAKQAQSKAPDTAEDALFRLNIAKGLVLSRNRARVKLIIFCIVAAGIGAYDLVSTDYDVGGIFWALVMLASIIGVIWAYNTVHGGADELYERCLKQYNELKAKEHGAEAESKAEEEN